MQLYTLSEVGKMFNLTSQAVRSWIKRGVINPRVHVTGPKHFHYLIDEEELMRFVDERFPRLTDLSPTSPGSTARLASSILFWKREAANEARRKRRKEVGQDEQNCHIGEKTYLSPEALVRGRQISHIGRDLTSREIDEEKEE